MDYTRTKKTIAVDFDGTSVRLRTFPALENQTEAQKELVNAS
jgi:hypothetical protein